MTCYRCGERESPRQYTGGFFLTKFPAGHRADSCTKERTCYNCGQPGHVTADCDAPRKVSVKRCFSCGEEGHVKCMFYSARSSSSSRLTIMTAECPQLKCFVRFSSACPALSL
ncbi:hypothetical protein ARMSODRAFT_143120 [Armillaria solidipes]|uniref:CCHC-type domain-containing protein n=1 Tax=Armillaria solidipes TaxID=1076256 RepID=A0A2H3BJ70_9AGAR|nr:hypothetical protein ARMSODRAFT_143120 [Armillaria solidipes]